MSATSRHLSVFIDRPAGEVYDYVRDPATLAEWAQGLGSAPREVDGRWVARTAAGEIAIEFAAHNDHGVVDHDITLPDGNKIHVYMRVLADGDGSEVVFTARRQPGASDDDFATDVELVNTDLAQLKRVLEARQV